MFFPTYSKVSNAGKRDNLVGIKNIVAFSSGRAKVGKTTISANLAILLAQAGLRVGLLDAEVDVSAASKILKIENSHTDAMLSENFGVKLLSIGLLSIKDPLEDWYQNWREYWLERQIERVLTDISWGNLDYLIVNLPPGIGDFQSALVKAIPLNGVVIVATAEKDTHPVIYETIEIFEKLQVSVLGLIENKCNYFSADLFKRKYKIQASKQSGEKRSKTKRIPFLGYVPQDSMIAKYGDRGLPIVLAEPQSTFTGALNAIVWAVSSRVTRSTKK